MRDYNYRMHVQDRVVKRRLLEAIGSSYFYVNCSYPYRRYYYGGMGYHEPKNLWIDYLGKYTRVFSKSRTYNIRKDKMIWDDKWHKKYHSNREKLKNNIKKKINDQVGERYYTLNK